MTLPIACPFGRALEPGSFRPLSPYTNRAGRDRHRRPPGRSARGEDAELVALWVGEDDPADVALADVDRLGADSAETCDLGAVAVVGEGCDIQVHPQLGGLGLADAVQVEIRAATSVVAEPDTLIVASEHRPPGRRRPELSDRLRVHAVEHDRGHRPDPGER